MDAANPRGGRPRAADPKVHRVNVRFAAAEHSQVERKAAAAGITMSEYLRQAVLRGEPRIRRVSAAESHIDPELFHELRRQGVNLHQIVKHLNIHGTPIGAFQQDLQELLARIRGIINRALPP